MLVSLAATPNVYVEDEAWGAALAVASLFALVGLVERPSWSRVSACGVLVLLTNLNRSTTGYACILATLLLAAWFALGRAGPERRRWAAPTLLAAFIPLVVGCAIDYAKFGQLFGFPASEQLLYQFYGFGHINGGKHFSLHFLPSTVQAYLSPGNLRLASLFPYLTYANPPNGLIAHTQLFNRGPSSSVPASMPLLFGLGLWGVVTTFWLHRPMIVRSFRILLVAAAASAGAMLIYGTIYERFLGDFVPLLVLAGAIGMVDIWRLMDGKSRSVRSLVPVAIGVLALFEFVANMGIAVTPAPGWSPVQASNYVSFERTISDVTGDPLSHDVVEGDQFPVQAPMGRLFIMGNCEALYIANQAVPKGFYTPDLIWTLVERPPHTPLCHGLLRSAGHALR